MGQTLSFPATEKQSGSGANDKYLYGLSEMQGWRISMEDAHTSILDLENENAEPNAFFAVYDGHGGATVAKYAGAHVHERLVTEDSYKEKQWGQALKRAFLGTDEDIRADPTFFRDPSGCTAVAALLTSDGKVVVANAGDSRAVLSVAGEAKPLSFDHKPSNELEKQRIQKAGGWVEYGRVNGNLALSRAIGDFEFKKNYDLTPEEQVITADPDITEHQLTGEDEFFVLACDGIWDCLSSQDVVNIVRLQLSQRREISEICEYICDHCLAPDTSSGAGVGCDNMTIMIVALLHGRTKEQYYDWMAERVSKSHGYETPTSIKSLYAEYRMQIFQEQRKNVEQRRAQEAANGDDNGGVSVIGAFRSPHFGQVSRFGGLAYHLGAGISSIGASRFADDDSDDDEVNQFNEHVRHDHDHDSPGGPKGSSFMSWRDADRPPWSRGAVDTMDKDGMIMSPEDSDEEEKGATAHHEVQGEAPPPPREGLTNGDSPKLRQLDSTPGGDEASPAVKAEGLMDGSEDPSRT